MAEFESDQAVLQELGRRLARQRLDRNLSQERLAAEAGVSRSSVRRLEAGEPTQLTVLIRVLRALRMLDNLEQLLPEPTVRPLEELERGRKERRRASPERREPEPPAADPWTWGEDA